MFTSPSSRQSKKRPTVSAFSRQIVNHKMLSIQAFRQLLKICPFPFDTRPPDHTVR